MLPATLQFLITMIACAINERMQRKLDYTQEEVPVLKEVLKAATGSDRIVFTAQLCAKTFRRRAYATASALKSWRNWRFGKAALLTDALIAGHGPVCCETLFPRLAPGRCQFRRQVYRRAEVDFVRGLAGKCRMWHLGVVLLNEERHESAQPLYRVERVQIQPLVL